VQSDTAKTISHELLFSASKGAKIFFDMTNKALGRDWEKIQKIVEEVGDKVHIVVGGIFV
jgi:predicted metal-dependent phosphotriesterase family hydrolase